MAQHSWYRNTVIYLWMCGMDNILKTATVCALVLGSTITVVTSAHVYAQINGDETSTQQWCENKKDELKDRVTDLMLVFFAPSTSTMNIFDFIDRGNVLVAETAEKKIDCADYLTGTEIQLLQGMHNAAALFVCLTDVALKLSTEAHPEGVSDRYFRCLGGPEI
jgi:hypothetical protein